LPTNTAVKKPLYYGQVYSTVIQIGKTDASMTFFRCIFRLLGSHINSQCYMQHPLLRACACRGRSPSSV